MPLRSMRHAREPADCPSRMTHATDRPALRHRHAADARDARRHGRRAGRRRPVRRRPHHQRAAGAHRRAARQGSRALAAHRHDGQPGGAARAHAAGRRRHRQRARRTPCGTRPAARRPTPACSSPRSARAASSPPRNSSPRASRAATCIYPPTTLVEIENTHNRAGGVVFPQDEAVRICAAARERGIATFLDGARLWNAAVATGTSLAELAAPFDLVAVALSKGLGAPGGSLLAGTRELDRARRAPSPHARRRDAPGRHLCRRRPARARPPSRAPAARTTRNAQLLRASASRRASAR